MILLILLALLCLPVQAIAQVVHFASPSGSTSASSCPQSAPCSLNRATALATSGHIVRALDGVYNQTWQTARDGSPDNPIVFESLNRHGAIIRWPHGDLSGPNPPLIRLGHDHITFRRFQIDGTGSNGSTWDMVRIGGPSAQAPSTNPAGFVIFEDNWAYQGGHMALGLFDAHDIIVRHNSFDQTSLNDDSGECTYVSSHSSVRPVNRVLIERNIFSRCTNNFVDYKGQARNIVVRNNIYRDFLLNFANDPGDGHIRGESGTAGGTSAEGNFFRSNLIENAVGRYDIRPEGNRVDTIDNVFINVQGNPFVDSRTISTARVINNITCGGSSKSLGARCGVVECTGNLLNRPIEECNARRDTLLGRPTLTSCSIGGVNASTVVGIWSTPFLPVRDAINANFTVTVGGAGATKTGTTTINNQSRTTLSAPATSAQTVTLAVADTAVRNSVFIGGLVADNSYTDYDGEGYNAPSIARTAITCTNNISSGDPPPPAGMVAHWKLDEAAGSGTAADSEGSNTGTLMNMNTSIAWGPGIIDGSIAFDGIDDFVSAGSAQLIDTDAPWSISLWANLDNFANTAPGLAMIATDVGQGFQILASTADASFAPITFGTSSGTIQRRFSTDFSAELPGTWNHIVIVYLGGGKTTATNYLAYRNSVSGAHQASSALAALGNINTLGKNGTSTINQMDGRLDDVRIYNFALDQSEVTALYNAGQFPPPPPDPETQAPFHLNAAGPNFTDSAAQDWIFDRQWISGGFGYNSVTGGEASTTKAIAGTVDDTLFQTWRFGEFSYLFPLPSDTYNITLYFVETSFNTVGSRVFTVAVEGQSVPALTNYDILADVGFDTAAIKHILDVPVTDGLLNIDFVPSVSTARVSAIRVVETAGEPGVTEVFTATDDAYICEVPGTCGKGNGVALTVRHTSFNEFRPILKFNLSTISFSAVNTAILKLNTIRLSGTTTVKAYAAASDNWNQGAVTWATAPAIGGEAASTSISAVGEVSFDVTSLVSTEVAGDKIVTIYLRDDATTGNTILFDARESGFPAATLHVTEDLP